METLLDKYIETAEEVETIKYVGHVIKVQGILIESLGPSAVIGEVCRIEVPRGKGVIQAEVVGLSNGIVQLMAYEDIEGIEIGNRVVASGAALGVAVSNKLLGRVLDAMGRPSDGKGEIDSPLQYPAIASPPPPLSRRRIKERIATGVRAIDGMLAAGRGQRLGIFAGSGVGKSTLLGMIARNTNADVNVVALIGERGREVNDFIENDLGPEGLARSVIIVTPSNSPPLARLRGAYTATAVAEYFRDQGLDVMLLFDSVTRFARAQREIGLAIGEPPATRGYTPSMFDSMPKLLERSGTSDRGSITGFYTILVDGDDMDEPVADTVRGILDGHIILSRDLAQRYHYPAIDVLTSISRLAPAVSGPVTNKAVGYIRRLMADYAAAEDLINVGAYRTGSNPAIDQAIAKREAIENFLVQNVDEKSTMSETLKTLAAIADMQIPDEELSRYRA
ncbi:flagellar protein export ATPase FliI [Treponema primitia ZAS-2]|uniref:Flagellar protein export ATPase FliI n=1 Tax=Treponema primitia (strain ATCC BAA-887 / DSM 12427 / ZAS-2) TaxID=545694 RepID=F5YGM3_TREPZ|nr:FliI/YscN family ATPase [Treponema primitia]AEF86514.1 flagellar protein export ATPase FliI [Treponema primitia ZAS-2]